MAEINRSDRYAKSKNEQIENQIQANLFFSTVKVSFMTNLAPQGQTVNQQYYREVLERLRKRVHRVRPETADTWMLHHSISPSYCHLRERFFFFTKKGIPVVPQPPYSPDLSPCDFIPFRKHKFHLKGRYFGTVDNIQNVVDRPAESTST